MKKSGSLRCVISFAILLTAADGEETGLRQSPKVDRAKLSSPVIKMDTDFGRMPLYFIRNEGQVDSRVGYYIQGKDKTVYFTPEGLTYVLSEKRGEEEEGAASIIGRREDGPNGLAKESPYHEISSARNERAWGEILGRERGYCANSVQQWVVKLDFVDANRDVRPSGEEKTEAVISYFRGTPEEWKTGIATYSRVVYRELWPGIDLVYHGSTGRLKYEFLVHPGADPSQIRLAYRGASAVEVNEEGRLQVMTPAGTFEDDTPVAWQEVEGERVEVAISYELEGNDEERSLEEKNLRPAIGESTDHMIGTAAQVYAFRVGDYDRTQTLVLDPAVFVYCGYIGGSSKDRGYGIAVDGAGNAYVTGYAYSTAATFPVIVGPDLIHNGDMDAFVAKVDSSGTALVYCGYIGGSSLSFDYGRGIAVDSAGNAYVTGTTTCTEATFPVTVGPDLTHNGTLDAFVAKVNPSGTALVYCGYVGGSNYDWGLGIAVDSAGNAYITGYTDSSEAYGFPVTVGPDLTYNDDGQDDAFVAKVNSSGTSLSYCGYIGGLSDDYGYGIAVDTAGNAYVTGYTESSEATFPVKLGPDLTHNGNEDAFVAKVDSSGTEFTYCGYIGGSADDRGHGIAVDLSGNAYVGGSASYSSTFPVKVGPDLTPNGYSDPFVAKVNFSGTALIYCGYIGGSADDRGHGIAIDSAGNAYITGFASSTQATFPVKIGPDLTHNGYPDAFVAKVNFSGTTLVYCGYIGGSDSEDGCGIAVDHAGNVYLTGYTWSLQPTFPVIVGPDLTENGNEDAFVAKICAYDPPPLVFGGHDFDGSGSSDIAVYRPSTGMWYVRNGISLQWGASGDVPVQGNYDLNATTDIAIWRPASGLWFISGISTTQWGMSGDLPIPHDYNGGGVTDLAVWRSSNGVWYINGVGDFQWGQDDDYPMPGDYDGDGVDEIAVWRPSDGAWYIYGGGYYQWGIQGDIPVPADYNGDGKTDIAVYRPSTGMWYIQHMGGGETTVQWGMIADIPAPGDYNGDGTTEIAIFRPSDGLWYIYGGGTYQFGQVGDIPLVR